MMVSVYWVVAMGVVAGIAIFGWHRQHNQMEDVVRALQITEMEYRLMSQNNAMFTLLSQQRDEMHDILAGEMKDMTQKEQTEYLKKLQ